MNTLSDQSFPTRAKRRTRWCDRRGVGLVEFAVVLPLLMTIVLGCVDFGRFAYTYIAVTNAARAGAGLASVNPVTASTLSQWQSQVRQAVVNEMQGVPGFNASQLVVPAPVVTTDAGGLRRVRVQVSYPFQMIVNWPLLPTNATLARAVEMRFID